MEAWLLFLFLADVCVFILAFAVTIAVISYTFSLYLNVPFVATPQAALPLIARTLDIREGDTVLELGSGDGRFVLYAARTNPRAHFIGIERNPLLHYYALARKRVNGNPQNASFRRENFFATDLGSANKIYGYLLTDVVNKLQPAFERDFRGTFASRAFQFRTKAPTSIIELSTRPGNHNQHLLYVYEF